MARFLAVIVSIAWFGPAVSYGLTNAWHIPDNQDIDKNGGQPNTTPAYVHERDPWMEISNSPANPTTVTIYQGLQKWTNNGGTQIANETGGILFYKGQSEQLAPDQWHQAPLSFHQNQPSGLPNNQYWKAQFLTSGIAANDPIQYFIYLTTDGVNYQNFNANQTGFIYAPQGMGDKGGAFVGGTFVQNDPGLVAAAASPFTVRDRPAWIFHGGNRVVSGDNVQFWAKVGYIGDATSSDPANSPTLWANRGYLYYTVDGTAPVPGATPGTASGSTIAVPFNFDHIDSQTQGQGSIAGAATWWTVQVNNLPEFQNIQYKIGFWNTANLEQKFADYNAGTANTTYSFSLGITGGPQLTVDGLNADYTTSKFWIDEIAGETQNVSAAFTPGQAVMSDQHGAVVEIYTNLDRRDYVDSDIDGDGVEDGIKPPYNNDATQVTVDHPQYNSAYFRPYRMTAQGNGVYSWTGTVSKTGAYRVTARFKDVNGNWIWYGHRDHAVVVSPRKALEMTLYELNAVTVDASSPDQTGRPARPNAEESRHSDAEFDSRQAEARRHHQQERASAGAAETVTRRRP